MKQYLKLMRVHHYVKNILIFFPLIFAGQVTSTDKLYNALLAFFAFSFLASAIYIINDIGDIEKDRNHPKKRKRPLASGAISKQNAIIVVTMLIALSLILQYLTLHPKGFLLLVIYFAINIAYSIGGLKEIPILDVIILAAGYIIRVLYGGIVEDIHVSAWLYLTVLAGSFYLGLGKRRGELAQIDKGLSTRPVLSKYSYPFLDKMMYLFLALANVLYALWAREAAPGMLLSVPFLWALSMKYSLIIEGESDGDPMEIIMNDRVLIGLTMAFVITIFLSLYTNLPSYL